MQYRFIYAIVQHNDNIHNIVKHDAPCNLCIVLCIRFKLIYIRMLCNVLNIFCITFLNNTIYVLFSKTYHSLMFYSIFIFSNIAYNVFTQGVWLDSVICLYDFGMRCVIPFFKKWVEMPRVQWFQTIKGVPFGCEIVQYAFSKMKLHNAEINYNMLYVFRFTKYDCKYNVITNTKRITLILGLKRKLLFYSMCIHDCYAATTQTIVMFMRWIKTRIYLINKRRLRSILDCLWGIAIKQ